MKKYYSYAGLHICIEGPDAYMYKDDRNLKFFQTEEKEFCHHYQFEVVDKLEGCLGTLLATTPNMRVYIDGDQTIRYIGSAREDDTKAYMRINDCGYTHKVQMKKKNDNLVIGTHLVYDVIESAKLITDIEGILLHASFIEHKGEAIVFTAPSGTGKSTQADLWVEHRNATIINGDRCALRFIDGKVYACGVPFAGSSNISKNKTLPLKCIVCLGQSPTTTLTPLHGYKAFRYLWEGVGVNTWDKDHVMKVSDIVERIVGCIPIYKLDCTPDVSAIEALEEYL
jgi:hypothetical protein